MWTTPAGVCEGRYCKLWLPWSPWHSLPPCCGRRWWRRVTISYSTVGGIELFGTVWGRTLSTLRLLWQHVRPAKSIFSAVLWLREKFRSLLQIYEAVLARAAQKSWLSAPPGKYLGCYTPLITLVPHQTGQSIGKSCMFFPPSLSSLTDKLVSVCAGLVQISECGWTCLQRRLGDCATLSLHWFN